MRLSQYEFQGYIIAIERPSIDNSTVLAEIISMEKMEVVYKTQIYDTKLEAQLEAEDWVKDQNSAIDIRTPDSELNKYKGNITEPYIIDHIPEEEPKSIPLHEYKGYWYEIYQFGASFRADIYNSERERVGFTKEFHSIVEIHQGARDRIERELIADSIIKEDSERKREPVNSQTRALMFIQLYNSERFTPIETHIRRVDNLITELNK